MIGKIAKGKYRLSETTTGTKILQLDTSLYAWVNAKDIGDLLVKLSQPQKVKDTLSNGSYELFEVNDEPDLTDLMHLELETGPKTHQGYLLLTGLPNEAHKRARIIATDQLIHGRKL